MTLEERIIALTNLGKSLLEANEYRDAVIHRSFHNNQWFTAENINQSMKAIATAFLEDQKLRDFAAHYRLDDNITPKRVGLIMAGNIPLVGFHDFLCIFLCGHTSVIKLSDKDPYLFPYLIKVLNEFDDRCSSKVELVDKLADFDGVIATGSNNSARYFHAYFDKYPNIIRKNRNSIAVLTGKETKEELDLLAYDILNYFGLGCRNVSKIYIPEGYDFNPIMETIHEHMKIILHGKYKNNFDYNFAVASLNNVKIVNNGCIILIEDTSLTSRIASLHYEYYSDMDALLQHLTDINEQIQCVVAQEEIKDLPNVSFGHTQTPGLYDYADGIDTMNMLLAID
jgi:hypothetical protein